MSSYRRTLTPVNHAIPPLFVGVDVGGTNIKIGLVDDRGATLAWTNVATQHEQGPDAALDRTAIAIRKLLKDIGLTTNDMARIGLGSPGTMDIPSGRLLDPVNMPSWANFPICQILSERCDLPVSFANDANAAAFGEFWVGAARDYYSVVLLTLGTGVGGGIIIGELSIDGENSHGSECGHIILDYHDSARVCSCGQRGHLEAYASATAVAKRTQEALDAGRASSLRDVVAAGEPLTALLVSRHAEAGDELALEIVLETARYLGIGIVTLMHAVDPGAVLLGGAMNFGGPDHPLGRRFLERVREEVRARAFPVPASRVVIEFAHLGPDAGYLGAAGIARAAYHRAARG